MTQVKAMYLYITLVNLI